jgi:hypothetical protein
MIHKIYLKYSIDAAPEFHDWLSTWLTNMQTWNSDGVDNSVPDSPTEIAGYDEEIYVLQLAFDWSEDESIIIDQIAGYLSSYATDYQIGYHECPHDGEGNECRWRVVASSQNPPVYIQI